MDANSIPQNQANRVADVSDALDDMPRAARDFVWEVAAKIYRQDDVSFLQAFEYAIANKRDRDERARVYDSEYCREHDC